jgi:phosphoglycolate phosphatase-like HAD superfamily hydrolase
MIRCVVFDFDGTLVMSNAIKRDGFFAVTAEIAGGTEAMTALLAAPPGDRFAVFAAFSARFGLDAGEMAEAYGAWCEAAILVAPERPGATEALAALRRDGIRIWINSATPEAPLRAIVKRRYPAGSFDGILGGHARKVANLRAVMSAEGLAPDEILMVGDGIDDKQGAAEAGCRFIGLNQGTLAASPDPGPMIADLRELAPLLLEVPA